MGLGLAAITCCFVRYADMRGRDYLSQLGYRHELKLARNSSRSDNLIYSDKLTSNDTRRIEVGIPHNGQIALFTGDAPVYGFRDGTFEYKLQCVVTRPDGARSYVECNIWLTIKDGVLVSIQKELGV